MWGKVREGNDVTMHATQVYGEVEVYLHSFLKISLSVGVWSASRSDRFNPGPTALGRRLGPVMMLWRIVPSTFDGNLLSPRSQTSRHIHYSISAHILKWATAENDDAGLQLTLWMLVKWPKLSNSYQLQNKKLHKWHHSVMTQKTTVLPNNEFSFCVDLVDSLSKGLLNCIWLPKKLRFYRILMKSFVLLLDFFLT